MSDSLSEVLRDLALIDPVDDREAASIRRVVTEAPFLAAPFDEGSDPIHVTASAFVVGDRGTVLHLHKKLGIWVQPGGHVDEGEEPATAALREAREETGLTLAHPPEGPKLVHVDVHPGPRGHTHFDLRYVILGASMDPVPPPGESQEVAWFGFDVAGLQAEPALKPALERLGVIWSDNEARWRTIIEELTVEARNKR